MCGMRLTGGVIDHLLCITVVCTDEQNAVHILHCLYRLAYALIYGLDRFDSCGDHAGMAYHIGVSEVDHDHIVFFRTDRIKQLLTYCGCTHLGLQIVGSYILGRIYQDTILSLVGLLYAAVEEEGYMCILLSLGDTCLLHSMCCQPLTEGIGNGDLVECHFFIRNGRIVIGEAYEGDILSHAVKSLEVIITESSGDLSCTVGTEVEENYGILVLHQSDCLAIFYNNSRFYKLIGLFSVVRLLDTADTAGSGQTFAFGHGIVSQLYTVIVVITIHSIVTSHYRSDLTYTDFLHFFI